MKITRRAKQRITLIVATRRAEAEAAMPQLNYESLFQFDNLVQAAVRPV